MSAHFSYAGDFTAPAEKTLVRHYPYLIYDLRDWHSFELEGNRWFAALIFGRQWLSFGSLGHAEQAMKTKKRAVLERIKSIEQAIDRATEYLESGKHAHWSGFRPIFVSKFKDGKEMPPHKDWVKNVFLPRMQKTLRRAEKVVERLDCIPD